jgi:uncharacterized protein (DUF2249 family)/iron-sulfur cluster repair protein YtfE (RIC family)
MSQTDAHTPAHSADDDAAAQAVLAHHAQLSAGLDQRVEALLHVADTDLVDAGIPRRDLVAYLRRDIVPHALAEEQVLYPPAAAVPEGRLLVAGMVAEHHDLLALVDELAEATSLIRAAAAARALSALFAAHLHKENDLVLPLLLGTEGVALHEVLAGMHELLGADHADHADADGAPAPSEGGGCGCGGCGCGNAGDDGGATVAPVLSVDSRLDVRDVPHERRHELVLSAVQELPPGQALVLVASHAPRPVLAEIDARFGTRVQAQWLQSGPQVWQVRLERTTEPA